MTKHYCDCCLKEIKRCVVSERVKGSVKFGKIFIDFEIICGLNKTWNNGNLCINCLWDAFHEIIDPIMEDEHALREEIK